MGLINSKGRRTHWLEFLLESEFSSDGSTLDTLTKGDPFTQVLAELREPAREVEAYRDWEWWTAITTPLSEGARGGSSVKEPV